MVVSTRRTRASARSQKHVDYDASVELDNDDTTDDIVQNIPRTRKKDNAKRFDNDPESPDAILEGEIGEDEDEDEDVYVPIRNKRQMQQHKTLNKKRQKRSKHTSAHVTFPSTIDDIENYQENPIFDALSNGDYTPADLSQSWFDDFITLDINTKFDALKDFLNFILRCSGCIVHLSRHDVINTDNAKETINEIQIMFAKQKYHEFPMLYSSIGNNKEWKEFPNNALMFVSSIILIAGDSGVLYGDEDQFIELLLEWISAMSTSNIRALRYVSTVFGLEMQSVLCKLSVTMSNFIDKFLRQLKRENESLKTLLENKKTSSRQMQRQVDSSNERIKLVEKNLELYKRQKTIIDNYINDFFNILFVHRYRDVASEIRLKCVQYLGDWMEQYPEMFLESIYLRYLGWLLTDQDSNVRSEVFKVLTKLYKKRVTVAALRQFTSYFKHKLIEIVIYETDFNARFNCLQLLNEIMDKGYLNDDDCIKLTSLLFVDNEDLIYPYNGSKANPAKFMREVSKFISKVEMASVSEILEQDEVEFEKVNKSLPFDSKKLLKIRSLLQILLDSYEYYLGNYCTSEIKKKKENSRLEKFSRVSQYVYQLKTYNDNNENFELLLDYLNFDFTALDISDSIQNKLNLNTKLQYLLLNLINGATIIYLQGKDNQFYKMLFPQNHRFKSVKYEKDNTYYLSKLFHKLSDICYYFHDDIEKINVIVNLACNILKFQFSHIQTKMRSLKGLFAQFCRYFSVINFPLCTYENNDSRYYDTITHQYISLFQNLDVEDIDLISEIDSILKEAVLTMHSKIKSKSSIIESLNKLYILSSCSYVTNHAWIEINSGLKLYSNSLCSKLTKIEIPTSQSDILEINEASEPEILTFLHIASSYISYSLKIVYDTHLNKETTPSRGRDLDTINTINQIQKQISLLTLPDIYDQLSISLIHKIAISYLNNALTISAFKAEFSALNDDYIADDEIVVLLRSSIGVLIVHALLKLFCVREYQYAELLRFESKLERDAEEDVNFTNYSVLDEVQRANDEDKTKAIITKSYEYLLSELTAKLLLCCKLNIIADASENEKLIHRIQKNAEFLGILFKKVLDGVGLFISFENEGSDSRDNNKSMKQAKITDLAKLTTRKLIDETEEEEEEEEKEEEVEEIESDTSGGEDENDPITNSDDDLNEVGNHSVNMEFSDIDEDDDNEAENSNVNRESSEISSFASSFPFTQ